MAADANSSVGQIEAINVALSNYYKDLTTYLTTGSGTYPQLGSYINDVEFTELHRVVNEGQSGGSSFPNGAAIENIHHICAINREYGLRLKSKNQYYSDGIAESSVESDFYAMLKQYFSSMLQGVI